MHYVCILCARKSRHGAGFELFLKLSDLIEYSIVFQENLVTTHDVEIPVFMERYLELAGGQTTHC